MACAQFIILIYLNYFPPCLLWYMFTGVFPHTYASAFPCKTPFNDLCFQCACSEQKPKNLSLNGICSQPWQRQSPPPEEWMWRLRVSLTYRKKLIKCKNTALFSNSPACFSSCAFTLLDRLCRAADLEEWRRIWCQTGGAVTCGFVHKWKSKNECETYLRWKCQSTDPVFFTLETLCLCTRKARWMASSVLWGTFLLSISISNHSRVHGLTLPYARLKTAFTLHQAWTSSNVCFMQIQQVKT